MEDKYKVLWEALKWKVEDADLLGLDMLTTAGLLTEMQTLEDKWTCEHID